MVNSKVLALMNNDIVVLNEQCNYNNIGWLTIQYTDDIHYLFYFSFTTIRLFTNAKQLSFARRKFSCPCDNISRNIIYCLGSFYYVLFWKTDANMLILDHLTFIVYTRLNSCIFIYNDIFLERRLQVSKDKRLRRWYSARKNKETFGHCEILKQNYTVFNGNVTNTL